MDKDPTAFEPNPEKGYNPTDYPGIKPMLNDKTPKGESEVNKTSPEPMGGSIPKPPSKGY
jgi:hypothetical protein